MSQVAFPYVFAWRHGDGRVRRQGSKRTQRQEQLGRSGTERAETREGSQIPEIARRTAVNQRHGLPSDERSDRGHEQRCRRSIRIPLDQFTPLERPGAVVVRRQELHLDSMPARKGNGHRLGCSSKRDCRGETGPAELSGKATSEYSGEMFRDISSRPLGDQVNVFAETPVRHVRSRECRPSVEPDAIAKFVRDGREDMGDEVVTLDLCIVGAEPILGSLPFGITQHCAPTLWHARVRCDL